MIDFPCFLTDEQVAALQEICGDLPEDKMARLCDVLYEIRMNAYENGRDAEAEHQDWVLNPDRF